MRTECNIWVYCNVAFVVYCTLCPIVPILLFIYLTYMMLWSYSDDIPIAWILVEEVSRGSHCLILLFYTTRLSGHWTPRFSTRQRSSSMLIIVRLVSDIGQYKVMKLAYTVPCWDKAPFAQVLKEDHQHNSWVHLSLQTSWYEFDLLEMEVKTVK